MIETLSITCPGCHTIIIIEKKTGKVIEVREPILEKSTGDRFQDAFQKVKESAERAEAKFKDADEKRKERLKNLDQIFKESIKKVQEEGEITEKPKSPYDLE